MKHRTVFVAIAVAVLLQGVASAEETKKESEASKSTKTTEKKVAKTPATAQKADPPGAKVYTNADLDRLFGSKDDDEGTPAPAAAPAAPQEAAGTSDVLRALDEERAKAAERQKKVAEAEAKVAEAEARVQSLEKRAREISNPLLPRPQLTPEEQAAWSGLGNEERLKRNQEALEAARKEVADAKAALARARAGA
jgi:hypothetical protein